MPHNVRVWDLPTRIFHWGLVASVAGLVLTSQIGGIAMEWHFRFGYTVLSLLLFRIVWGVIGGRWSRFTSFLYSPATIWGYLRGHKRTEHDVGHNPLGSIAVFAMLCVLLAQAGSGLMSDDEIAAAGPLTKFVSGATVSLSTGYHKGLGKVLLLSLVLIHFFAIGFYLFKRKVNLVSPMIYGDKRLSGNAPPSRDDTQSRLIAVGVFAVCGCAVCVMLFIAAYS